MPGVVLWSNQRWRVELPARAVTSSHLVLIDTYSSEPFDEAAADSLLNAYRQARSMLAQVRASRGFQISLPFRWRPGTEGIGEPEPYESPARVLHVFGRGLDDHISPVRVMGIPRSERPLADGGPSSATALLTAAQSYRPLHVEGPVRPNCDGCAASVTRDQERWRADEVRVIRPHTPLIDAQALVLPLRHVVSAGDLTAAEVASIYLRLCELLEQFKAVAGSTGLSCFLNDGSTARQETPHVHLHVFGRATSEHHNPFQLLIPSRPPTTSPT